MKNMYKYEIKKQGKIIILIKNFYNNFVIEKITGKSDISIIFNTKNNLFYFSDDVKNTCVDFKSENIDVIQSYFKKVLGSEEIPTVLFNTHFVLSATKKCCEKLKNYIIDLNWNDGVLQAYNRANLLCGIDSNINITYGLPCEYNANNSIVSLLKTRFLSPNFPYNAGKELKDPTSHIDFANAFEKYNKSTQKAENRFGVLNYKKAQRITNSLYWTNKITGVCFDRLAEIFIEQKYEIEELPYNNISDRITDNPVIDDIIEKIRTKIDGIYNKEKLIKDPLLGNADKIRDRVELNKFREGNLQWAIAHALYTGNVPENIGAVMFSRYEDRWVETRNALLFLLICSNYDWFAIKNFYALPTKDIREYLDFFTTTIEISKTEKMREKINIKKMYEDTFDSYDFLSQLEELRSKK